MSEDGSPRVGRVEFGNARPSINLDLPRDEFIAQSKRQYNPGPSTAELLAQIKSLEYVIFHMIDLFPRRGEKEMYRSGLKEMFQEHRNGPPYEHE